MRLCALAVCTSLAMPAIAQDPSLEVTNFRGVISTRTHATTGNPYPYPPTTPPGYTGAGVAAGTRCWIYTPRLRLRAGHQGTDYLTITGMSQVIRPGAATVAFPNPANYQFATGLAPVMPVAAPEGFRHATTGADLLSFPAGAVSLPSFASYRHNFALASPVVMPDVEMCTFVEYKGGEQQDHATINQVLRADWKGGPPAINGVFYGFTVGVSPRTVSMTSDPTFRGQIGMTVKEPMFTATGFHANNYDPAPPLANEDFRAVAAAYSDWSTNGTVNATLFFHVSAGSQFANGVGTVLMNLGPTPVTIRIPTPFGFLLVAPFHPLFSVFPSGGLLLNLDPSGDYTAGPSVPMLVPPNPGLAGRLMTTQAILLDTSNTLVRLTNSSTISIR